MSTARLALTLNVTGIEQMKRVIEAAKDLAEASYHSCNCPASEWSGTQPECNCGLDDAVDELLAAASDAVDLRARDLNDPSDESTPRDLNDPSDEGDAR